MAELGMSDLIKRRAKNDMTLVAEFQISLPPKKAMHQLWDQKDFLQRPQYRDPSLKGVNLQSFGCII